jgi:hypothetical protein
MPENNFSSTDSVGAVSSDSTKSFNSESISRSCWETSNMSATSSARENAADTISKMGLPSADQLLGSCRSQSAGGGRSEAGSVSPPPGSGAGGGGKAGGGGEITRGGGGQAGAGSQDAAASRSPEGSPPPGSSSSGGGGSGGGRGNGHGRAADALTQPHTEPHPSKPDVSSFPRTEGINNYRRDSARSAAPARPSESHDSIWNYRGWWEK